MINNDFTVTINGSTITYTYDAAGTKLRKVVSGTTTDYAGNYIYENTTLQFFNHGEGYVKNNSGTFSYVYQYRDHLGNIRLSYADANNDGNINATTEIVEESNYYPFGLKHKGYNNVTSGGNAVAQKFKYNGIELEEVTDLYEMDFRSYDPAIARWTGIDPITHNDFSPYQAFDNNPVFFADPSGANSIYNFDTGQYVINGQEVSQDEAIAYANNGGNAGGSNNNTKRPEWASGMGFLVHQRANKEAYYGRGKSTKKERLEFNEKVKILDKATVYADSDEFQNGESSLRHAMKNRGQSPDEAKSLADKFVRGLLIKAKKLLQAGNTSQAYFQFGIALHTLQDATSPSHSGFKMWDGHETLLDQIKHVSKELFYPGKNSNLQKVTNQYVDWFESSSTTLPLGNLFNNIKSD